MNKFYLGRMYDLRNNKVTKNILDYDPADLTTHAVITGMTGSGKTGLCITIMEEAALQGIPAIIVDVKGDLTNLLLHFPDLAPQDFQPWLDAESIRRAGKGLEQAASETAKQWKDGLEESGIDQERIRALHNAAQFSVYTPGSDAGIQVSVLSSLEAPSLPWEGNKEILREKISATVTALLGLVGVEDIDPIRSREHILLANIFENAWSKGKSLDMTELIMQVQTPPFTKLGAFALENFFPEKDRGTLAMLLNNILAAPSFETWREGQALNIPSLLFGKDGRPRHSVFYIAHLSESERMFFVTLLLSAVETWMRTQTGSISLRALVYFDEIFGYLPPTKNPPSKTPLLRMLKQARAFGVGLVLATQNPVDVDYKALSNAGTWFVGKLQTERDKERLLDGLQSLDAGINRNIYGQVISSLGKRVFLMHNIHEKTPALFQTRWSMNYLAGPLTRAQIPALNQLSGADVEPRPTTPEVSFGIETESTPEVESEAPEGFAPIPIVESKPKVVPVIKHTPISTPEAPQADGSLTKPSVPAGIAEFYLPMNYTITESFKAAGEAMSPDAKNSGVIYHPVLFGSAQVRFLDRKLGVDSEVTRTVVVDVPDRRGALRWDDFVFGGVVEQLDTASAPQARFAAIESVLADAKIVTALQKDFADWLFRSVKINARANEALKVFAGPDVSSADFRKACADAARAARDAEISKLAAKIDKEIRTLQDKLAREERELRQDESELENRKWEANATHAENVMSLFGGRNNFRRLSSSLSKHRQTEQTKADVEESLDAIQVLDRQIADLSQKREDVERDVNERWAQVVNEITEVALSPKKADVYIRHFGIGWMPFYVIEVGGETFELPAFGEE